MRRYDYLCSSVVRWSTMTNIRAENVVDRFVGLELSAEKISTLLVDMKDRLSILEARSFLLMIISFLVSVFLFVGVYFPEREVSILEISSQALASVKEISLFVASTVMVASSILSMNAGTLGAAFKKMYFFNKGGEGELAAANLVPGYMFGSENKSGFYRDEMFLIDPIMWIFKFFPYFMILFSFLYTVFSFFVHFYIVVEVWSVPSVNQIFSRFVVFYAIICMLCSFYMSFLHNIPVPFIKFNNKFYTYVRNLGDSEYEKYCISAVTWRRRPILSKFLFFSFGVSLVSCAYISLILNIIWQGEFEYKDLGYLLIICVLPSVVLSFFVWRTKFNNYMATHRRKIELFDANHYLEWQLSLNSYGK